MAVKWLSLIHILSLSPASASFDLYANFAERGNHFKRLVNALK